MIVIGEKINSSSRAVKNAIDNKDEKFIRDLAQKQYDAGAAFIDLNAGAYTEGEQYNLEWLVKVVQEVTDAPFSIDSPNSDAIRAALKVNKNSKPIVNSITAEKERFKSILPLVLEYNTSVIALCLDGQDMPETIEERIVIAHRLVEDLTREGVSINDIYLDPLVRPVGTGARNGVVAMETINRLKSEFGDLRVVCGISNISFGMPARNLMNQAFLVAAMVCGVDAGIMDPLDKKLMSLIYAAEALTGKDEFCMNYQMKFREGIF